MSKQLRDSYREVYDIVKRSVDKWDCIGLLEMGAPQDEYDIEIARIVPVAYRTNDTKELADKIENIFIEYFGKDTYKSPRKDVDAIAEEILENKYKLKPTYFIPKNELPGSCYYEFQGGEYKVGGFFRRAGKIKLDNSLYLYEDELSCMSPFSYFAKDFSMFGITCLKEQNATEFIKHLRHFAELLRSGKNIAAALEQMGLYNPRIDGSWSEEDMFNSLDMIKLQNTADVLADWTEKQLEIHGAVSILGI
ncbi:MAG: DUF1871 family protein [Clostridiales bacterium]|nr:DUF1871 family protein [Clostridiales bacterium]